LHWDRPVEGRVNGFIAVVDDRMLTRSSSITGGRSSVSQRRALDDI
jgi:hypothetical protein